MATLGGPASSVSVVTDGRPRQGGPALPVSVVTDGRAVEGDAADPVYVVSSGPMQAGPAQPIVAAAAGAKVKAGPALPVYVVSGSLGARFVNQSAATTAATASWVVPYASAGGTCLVACIAVRSGATTTISTVTDSAGNSWTKGPIGFVAGNNTRIEIWFALNAAAVTSITITPSASVAMSINVSEYAGIAALDQQNSQANPTASDPATGTITTTAAAEIVVGALAWSSTATQTLTTAGFTALTNVQNSAQMNLAAAYQIVGAVGAYSVAWHLSAASNAGGAILSLRAA